MECFEPGEIIVLPAKGGAGNIERLFKIDRNISVKYSIEDVLKYYISEKYLEEKYSAYPFILNVPEGKEVEYSDRIKKDTNGFVATIPNYYVKPSSENLKINKNYIKQCLINLGCYQEHLYSGKGIKIAIIDTGVTSCMLTTPQSLHKDQFSTNEPNRNLKPVDLYGHGTGVAFIINSIVPEAELYSIKMMDKIGNIGGLLTAIYIAETRFKPDIYNLSLSVSCRSTYCNYCNSVRNNLIGQIELFFSFMQNYNNGRSPFIIAAAGNSPPIVKMPASFHGVLAVGSCDDLKTYNSINPNLFIMAPGGNNIRKNCMFFKRSYRNEYSNYVNEFGTSYSTAFVTGVVAKYLCLNRDKDLILECLKNTASTSIKGYNKQIHGMGIVHFDLKKHKNIFKSI